MGYCVTPLCHHQLHILPIIYDFSWKTEGLDYYMHNVTLLHRLILCNVVVTPLKIIWFRIGWNYCGLINVHPIFIWFVDNMCD